MTGYNWKHGKSDSAVEAEKSGHYHATKCGKILGIATAVIKSNLSTSEWHHTGKFYQKTDYYDIEVVREWAESPEGKKAIAEFNRKKDERRKSLTTKAYINCKVSWFEWPKTSLGQTSQMKVVVEDCVVLERGYFINIVEPDGKTTRKKTNAKSFIEIERSQEVHLEQAEILIQQRQGIDDLVRMHRSKLQELLMQRHRLHKRDRKDVDRQIKELFGHVSVPVIESVYNRLFPKRQEEL